MHTALILIDPDHRENPWPIPKYESPNPLRPRKNKNALWEIQGHFDLRSTGCLSRVFRPFGISERKHWRAASNDA